MCLAHGVSLTYKLLVNPRFVVPRDQYQVDGKTGSDDGESNETLDSVVEQWKHHKERHDDQEEDWQQNIHLQQHVINTGTHDRMFSCMPGYFNN